MLRYEKFTIGHAWAVEYGTAEKKIFFDNLISIFLLPLVVTSVRVRNIA